MAAPDITLSDAALSLVTGARGDIAAALDVMRRRHAAEGLGYLALAETNAHADAVVAWLATAPASEDVVLVGIGGSALSAQVFDALRPDPSAGPRLHVLDTVDPLPVERVLRNVDPTSALLVAISKSGSTLETCAVFSVLEAAFQTALGAAAAERIVVIAGAEDNPLRAHAAARGYPVFSIPAGVGGRFSALSAVGLLPAALVGVDPSRLVEGAAEMASVVVGDGSGGVVSELAALHLGAERAGRQVHVLWSYGERLRWLGPWWAQLAGESLGKPGADGAVGITAVAARGPADQHSLLQPVLEGRDDKLVVFVSAPGPDGPVVPDGGAAPAFAAGASLGQILDVECQATAAALAEVGRPFAHVRLPDAHASAVGAFLLIQEAVVAVWGAALGIDPFTQPAVGRGKAAARERLES